MRDRFEGYQELIDQARDGMFVLDPSGRFLVMNEALCAMVGCDRATTEGMSVLDTYPDALRPAARESLDQLQPGQAQRLRRSLKRMDGSVIQVEGSQSRLQGGVVLGILHDAAPRPGGEGVFASEHALFDTLMDNVPDYIYFKDLASRFVRTSRSHARAMGLRHASEAVGKTDADFYAEDHARKALDDEREIIRSGVALENIEERETYPDGSDAWVITTKMPLRDATGTIVGTFGITHDISTRKALEENNQLLATLVESVEDAIVGMDLHRRITAWNKGAERLYGYTAEEMIGSPTSTLIPPDLEEDARVIRERILRGEHITQYETTRLRKGGQRVAISLTLSAVRDPQGQVVGLASVARDITGEKELQAQVDRARRLESLGTLTAGIAHQFNNINTAVSGYLQLLRTDRGLPIRLARYVEGAAAAVRRAADITDRLLTLTKPPDDPVRLCLDHLVQEVLADRDGRIAAEGVHLVLHLTPTPPVLGSEDRIRFVLASLLDNALDSLLDRPQRIVTVRTGAASGMAWVEVEDTGCGIRDEDLPRVFTPFYTGKGEWAPQGSPQSRLKGAGLSLAITNTTVTGYGGSVGCRSTPGVGSTFRIAIPLAGNAPTAAV